MKLHLSCGSETTLHGRLMPRRPLGAVRHVLFATALAGFLAFTQSPAGAQSDNAPPPPPIDEPASDGVPPPPEQDGGEIVPLEPGEAVVTRFSHTVVEPEVGAVIDVTGISASILDIRRPSDPPSGQHWIDEPQRMPVTAGEVGQVFGVTLMPREDATPDIYLAATAAFGLHRDEAADDWMAGMWGPDAGPGTIYRISEDNGYLAEKFADVMLDGRANTGASLGNVAVDRWNNHLLVSDLETGMIHVLDVATGKDLGHFDHGVNGRTNFTDVWTNASVRLDPVAFNPDTKANIENCAGNFSRSPECWNLADFRRRVWGLDVRRSEDGEIRLYYAVWGSDAFGNADWAGAGDDRRNSVWSVRLGERGMFDTGSVRREFFLPAFWPETAQDKAGNSNPASDITFPDCGPQTVMLVAERGGMRNLGLDKPEAFSRPYESRVLRYELGKDGAWRPVGRYDVGFHDRSARDGTPFIFANSAGGADFGYGFGETGAIDTAQPSRTVWMTGDGLCSPSGACTNLATGMHDDTSEVSGLQGTPADGFVPVERTNLALIAGSAGAADFGALDDSYMIDSDINVDQGGGIVAEEQTRNDATRIGDVAIYQICNAVPRLPIIDIPEDAGPPPALPPVDWPVHTLRMSHDKWASSGHTTRRSWHRRDGSWHWVDRSWHWKSNSWHLRSRSWHWREGSWHSKERSWHQKDQSLHQKNLSWHSRNRSWHMRTRSYHVTSRSWDGGHVKERSYHVKGRTWGEAHVKGSTYHVKGRTWGGGETDHVKGRTYHVKGRTWDGGGDTGHVKGRTYHVKGRTWDGGGDTGHVKGRTYHMKGQTWGGSGTGKPEHTKKQSRGQPGGSSGEDNGRPQHTKRQSQADQGGKPGDGTGGKPRHSKKQSQAVQGGKPGGDTGGQPRHSKRQSQAEQGGKPGGGTGGQPRHSKKQSQAVQGGNTGGGAGAKPKHNKRQSQAQQGGGQSSGSDAATEQQRKKKKHAKDASQLLQ